MNDLMSDYLKHMHRFAYSANRVKLKNMSRSKYSPHYGVNAAARNKIKEIG